MSNTVKSVPRVLAAHDLSGWGRCSLAEALPVLSVMGAQVVSMPTAVFTAHTGYKNFRLRDLTDFMSDAYDHWCELGIKFDAVYSGFLGSGDQIDVLLKCFERFGKDALIVVDPVMGDDGKAYPTYTPEMCRRMSELCRKADIITPNVTEAAILLGKDYTSAPRTPEDFEPWLRELSRGGEISVVITGMRPADCRIGQVWFDRESGDCGYYERPFAGQLYHGTGDLYTSVLTGALLGGQNLAAAVARAADFVRDCCELSFERGETREDGVRYEELLWKLVRIPE